MGKHAAAVAASNQMKFLDARAQLRAKRADQLESIHKLLERDYRVMRSLLLHGRDFQFRNRWEQAFLHLDFQLMRLYYTLSQRFSIPLGYKPLCEMTDIIGRLANILGEHTGKSLAL